jgi:hypothetical protein
MSKEKNPQKIVFDIAYSKIKELVISQENNNEVYAVVDIKDKIETISLTSRRALDWLRELDTEVHGQNFYKNILDKISSKAQIDQVRTATIHNRIAYENNSVYYDLASKDGGIIEINSEGVRTYKYQTDMPFFRKSASTQAQVEPRYDDSEALDKLSHLERIRDSQIYQVHLVGMFLEHIPIPIMDFGGPAGSMKSTDSAITKRIIDPNGVNKEDNISSIPKTIDNMIIHLFNRYLIVYDNLSYITKEVSDTLCKAITGSSNSKRILYSDMDEILLSIKRKLIINGIAPNLNQPDLQDRIISYEREALEEKDRLTEEEIEEKFQQLLPSVLGQIFTTIHKAMQIINQIRKEIKPQTRMADFEIWGEAISRSLGYKSYSFLNKYHDKIKRKSVELIESQPLVKSITELVDLNPNYENSMEGTLKDLRTVATKLGIDVNNRFERFPKSPSKLSSELVIMQPHLTKLGIKYGKFTYTRSDGKYSKNATIVTFSKVENSEASEPRSLLSIPENIKKREMIDYFSLVP